MRIRVHSISMLAFASFVSPVITQVSKQKSAEMQVLSHWIGDWETEVTNKTSNTKVRSLETKSWSKGGNFILSEDVSLPDKQESHFLITYDPKSKLYRSCLINSSSVNTILGTWDGKSKTMKWRGEDPAGNSFKGWTRFIDKDNIEWSMVITDPDGKVLADYLAKSTRSKMNKIGSSR